LELLPLVANAGCWFLQSGIQEPDGGVARYYLSDTEKNARVSAEITGYAASAFAYLHSLTGRPAYLDAAVRAARYLTRKIWDPAAPTFPFEPASPLAYFFDSGIIVRGLLAVSRLTGEREFLDRARDAALSMAFDFMSEDGFHPVISLPDKQPLPREARWSRNTGCYQLKPAMAWLDLGEEHASQLYDSVLAYSLATHESFVRAEASREKQMDRLHAYCYFLEGLLAAPDRDQVRNALRAGIVSAAQLFREIAPEFKRSDVSAQLLRVRLIAHHLGAVPLDEAAAEEEARCARSFQIVNADSPKMSGGFCFGKRGVEMLPFVNPVSTAFCLQALELWEQHVSSRWSFDLHQLI
jgi:hypothetical protein